MEHRAASPNNGDRDGREIHWYLHVPQRFLHSLASSLASLECLCADSTLNGLDLASLPVLNASSQSLCIPGRSLEEITMGYWPIGPFTSLESRISK